MTQRDIPAFLHHLNRDRRTGLPVPMINCWSSEQDRRGELRPVIRFDPLIDAEALFSRGNPGRGRADFTHMHPARQRRAMVLRRCQVCNYPVDGDGWLPIGPGIETDMVGLPPHAVGLVEPWLCGQCADYAGRHCPALIRRRRGESLEMLRARPGDRRLQLAVSEAWIEGRLEARTKRNPVVLWAKLVITDADLAARALELRDRAAAAIKEKGGAHAQ